MNRRYTLRQLLLAPLIPALGLSAGVVAAQQGVTKSTQILDALAPKDIVLDTAGRPTRPRADPRINLTVQFSFDSAELLPQGKRQLDELAMALGDARLQGAGFELAGHTDRVGDAAYNLRLSLERAQAVRNYLMDAHGLAPQRLQATGYGFERLLMPNQPQAAANRRVEVRRLLNAAAPEQPSPARLVPTPK
ncbi:MAG: OmpA family protein [Burkholderiales bacterium]|jgi:outer membrane protein OmpA-like peptidoglycan-associated protein